MRDKVFRCSKSLAISHQFYQLQICYFEIVWKFRALRYIKLVKKFKRQDFPLFFVSLEIFHHFDINCEDLRLYLSKIPTYNPHFNSHLNSHFLLSRRGNSPKNNSHFYLIDSGNLSGNYKWEL